MTDFEKFTLEKRVPAFTSDSTESPRPNECPVCGNLALPHEKYCGDCAKHKKAVEERKKHEAREKAFGNLWPNRNWS